MYAQLPGPALALQYLLNNFILGYGAAVAAVNLQNGTFMIANSVDVFHRSAPVCGLKEMFALKHRCW